MRRCWFERTAGRAVHGRRRLIRRFVHDVPILRGLPVHEQYACAEGFREALFAPGDVVIRQGDEADYFYILEEGGAKCSVRLPGESEQFPVAQYGAEWAVMAEEVAKHAFALQAGVNRSAKQSFASRGDTFFHRHVGQEGDIEEGEVEDAD